MKKGECGKFLAAVWQRMQRTKHLNHEDTNTDLKRCLSLQRLILIGVGKTVGVGIYVLIGVATKEYAGPSVILAFVLAFVATIMNAFCFAEFASKNTKTGAQYTYMYESIGELVAFIVGWNGMLGYVSAFSLGSRGWSGYVDSIFDHAIQNFTVTHIANWSSSPPMPTYPDLPAIFIVLIVMVITSFGVQFSTLINAILAGSSGLLLIFITIFGLFHADMDNWTKAPGGFFPYGFKGVLKASSACFYAFQGFEILGFSAEETVNPKKNVPRSIVTVLVIVMFLYLGVAISFTLMIPYTEINTAAPFPGAFQYNGITWARYVVSIGPLFALSNLCVLEMYTISRLSFSMSEDGLLFSFLSKVNKRTKVPVYPVLVFGPIVIILVLVIDLSNLIGFMVIYIFIQYSLFASYLIVLRYQPVKKESCNLDPSMNPDSDVIGRQTEKKDKKMGLKEKEWKNFKRIVSVKRLVVIIYVASVSLAILLVAGSEYVTGGNLVAILGVVLLSGLILAATFMIWCKEQHGEKCGFLVPLMPFLPVVCLFFNMVMLVSALDQGSMVAAVVMAAIGAVVYMIIVVWDVARDTGVCDEERTLLTEDDDDTENIQME